MDKLKKAFLSKTNWAVMGLLLYNGLDSVKDVVPDDAKSYVTPALAIAAWIFRTFPVQKM